MIVLGIDPGSRRCGFGVVERVGSRLVARRSGTVEPGARPLAERLGRIFVELTAVLRESGADAVSVETAFCGASARSALVLGQARGVALAAAAAAGLPVFEYAPSEVKRAFTGSGQADKAQMVRTARALLGVEAGLPDEADALAAAVCHLARRGPAVALVRRRQAQAAALLRPSVRRYGAGR
ncbi:MAG: crossover junction endodeoxyribonuclease RuvC [Deltaproteobacteria bacterium]|nr:crossover junction endodeoxyribonuclease RuvC [Deltaproteobacteria bacterium]